MSNNRARITGGETLNREVGGDYKYAVGGESEATGRNAGPNAAVHAGIQTNDVSVKAGVGAEAEAFKLTGKNVEAKVFGVEAGADAEAGATGVSGEADAKVTMVDAEGAGMGVHLGAGVSTGGSIGVGGVSGKVLGTGFSLGKKTSISVFDNEVSIDFGKLGKALKFW